MSEEKIKGFVKSKFGWLPYENYDDKVKLTAYAQVYDQAIAMGKIVDMSHLGQSPKNNGANITQRKVWAVINSHTLKNLELIDKLMYHKKVA